MKKIVFGLMLITIFTIFDLVSAQPMRPATGEEAPPRGSCPTCEMPDGKHLIITANYDLKEDVELFIHRPYQTLYGVIPKTESLGKFTIEPLMVGQSATITLPESIGCYNKLQINVQTTDGHLVGCPYVAYIGKGFEEQKSECFNERLQELEKFLEHKEAILKTSDLIKTTSPNPDELKAVIKGWNYYSMNEYKIDFLDEVCQHHSNERCDVILLPFFRAEGSTYKELIVKHFDTYDSMIQSGEISQDMWSLRALVESDFWNKAEHKKKAELAERYYLSTISEKRIERTLTYLDPRDIELGKKFGAEDEFSMKMTEVLDGKIVSVYYRYINFQTKHKIEEKTKDASKYEDVTTDAELTRDVIWYLDAMKHEDDLLYIMNIIYGLLTGKIKARPFLAWKEIFEMAKEEIEGQTIIEEQAKSTVALFIDQTTYLQLEDEIQRYANDIENDSNVTTKIFYQESWESGDVKNKLWNLFNTSRLLGTILIGDIPPAGFVKDFTGAFNPSDVNYTMFISKTPDIWIGRIKPPIDDIQLLKDYFDRNHEERINYPSSKKGKFLYFPAMGGYADPQTECWMGYNTLFECTVLYADNSTHAKQEYLRKLRDPSYEFAFFDGHGSPTRAEDLHKQFVSPGVNIDYQDIKDTKPQPLFYILFACYNGKWTVENYIGGWYLFAGNGLVVRAWPDLASGFWGPERFYTVLEIGGTFGDAIKSEGIGVLLGDPTLRLRSKPFQPRNLKDIIYYPDGWLNKSIRMLGKVVGISLISRGNPYESGYIVVDKSFSWPENPSEYIILYVEPSLINESLVNKMVEFTGFIRTNPFVGNIKRRGYIELTSIKEAPEFIQTCEGKDFEIDPDIEYQLSTTKIDLDDSLQILGHIDVAGYLTIIDIGATTYHITGLKSNEIKNYHGRKLLVTAKPVVDSELINEIDVIDYEVIPYSVLTGKLSIKTITRRGTNDWLILNTFVNGEEYNFVLMDIPGEMTKYLTDIYVGKEVTVSGVISPISYTGYQSFYLNSICEAI